MLKPSIRGTGIVLAFSALLLVAGACTPADADRSALEARYLKIEDENAIRDLMMSYGQFLDRLDFEHYSQLFAEEGEWSGLLGEFTTVRGPEAIKAAMEQAFADRIYDPDHVTNVHLVSNIRIDVDGDRATGYSRWTVLSRDDSDRPQLRLTGRYDDVFIREDGRWKFLSRTASREIP